MKKMFMQVVVLLAALMLMVACSSNTATNETSVKNEESGNGAKEGITLRVMDWLDSSKHIREEFHKRFMEKYPEVTNIEYTTLTQDQFRDTILAAVRSGDAPDLFPPPVGYSFATLVEDGWYQPLEPYVEDEFFDIFSDGIFREGVSVLDGKIYAIPLQLPQPTAMVFYNKTLFKEAGLDPEKPPTTYEEFREYAKKIAEVGKGKYYGLIEGGRQTNRFTATINEWGSLNGAALATNSPVNKVTGEAPYHTEAVTDIFDLFAGMAQDGSIHPRTSSLTAPEARQLFANGEAGFIIQGAWNIGVWGKNNPDLDYGVMMPPFSKNGRKGSIDMIVSAGHGISADSKHPELAAKYLEELYGGDYYQQALVKEQDSYSVVKGINEENAEGKFKEFYDLFSQISVVGPIPESENSEVTKVLSEYVDVKPNAGEILQGVAIAGVKDYENMLKDLSKKTDEALAKAIKAAQDKGAKVSADDFKFEWDQMSHYE